MEIKQIRTENIEEEIMLYTEGTLPRVLIDFHAQIDNDKLQNVEVESSAEGNRSIIPSTVPQWKNWEYLEKLTKFLNEVLKLQEK